VRHCGSHIFLVNQFIDGGVVVRLKHWLPFTPRKFLVLISVRGWVDPRAIVWLEGLGQLKNPMTSSKIEPATFQLVAQWINKLCYHVPCLPFLQYLNSKLKDFIIFLNVSLCLTKVISFMAAKWTFLNVGTSLSYMIWGMSEQCFQQQHNWICPVKFSNRTILSCLVFILNQ
jgi:hypothetical protein